MNFFELALAFLCGYALRAQIGVHCLAGALTRIERKLGIGTDGLDEARDGTLDGTLADAPAAALETQPRRPGERLQDRAREVH